MVNRRLAVRGETNAQKQGKQKRPGTFHNSGLPILAIRRPPSYLNQSPWQEDFSCRGIYSQVPVDESLGRSSQILARHRSTALKRKRESSATSGFQPVKRRFSLSRTRRGEVKHRMAEAKRTELDVYLM